MKKTISILTPCFNEEDNVEELYRRILLTIDQLSDYLFEIIFIDNASQDQTIEVLKRLAAKDPRLKIIVNQKNFGHLRSPYWGLMQTSGEATIAMASDLQDPPEMIPKFISEWEKGWKVVLATKAISETNPLMHGLRKLYYKILNKISNNNLIENATGFGLYDKIVLNEIRKIQDPYPYIRGLITEFGYPITTIPFDQPNRFAGTSKNNFYSLFDIAMLGIVSHSVLALRFSTFFGLGISFFSFMIAIYYLVMKLLYWDAFSIGLAPLLVGFFLISGLLFIFIGLLGEYIASIHRYVKRYPIVIEKERINF
jgi:dolichol-phosphate mannosyltransferase